MAGAGEMVAWANQAFDPLQTAINYVGPYLARRIGGGIIRSAEDAAVNAYDRYMMPGLGNQTVAVGGKQRHVFNATTRARRQRAVQRITARTVTTRAKGGWKPSRQGRPTKMYGRKRPRMSHARFAPAPVEKKMHVTKFEMDDVAAVTGNIASIVTGIIQGNNYEDRVGSKLYIHNFDIKGTIQGDQAGGIAQTELCDVVRVVVLIDMQSNGTTPTWADVYDMRADSITNPTDAYRNLENTSRFNILYDKRHMVKAGLTFAPTADQSGIYVPSGCKLLHIHKEFRTPIVVTYDDKGTAPAGQDGSSAHIRTNNIWILAAGNAGSTTDNGKFGWVCRLRYTD